MVWKSISLHPDICNSRYLCAGHTQSPGPGTEDVILSIRANTDILAGHICFSKVVVIPAHCSYWAIGVAGIRKLPCYLQAIFHCFNITVAKREKGQD